MLFLLLFFLLLLGFFVCSIVLGDFFFLSWQSDWIFEFILKEDATSTGYGICLSGSCPIVSENSAGSYN